VRAVSSLEIHYIRGHVAQTSAFGPAELARIRTMSAFRPPSAFKQDWHNPPTSNQLHAPLHAFRAHFDSLVNLEPPSREPRSEGKKSHWMPRRNGPTVRMGKMAVELCAKTHQSTCSRLTGNPIILGIWIDSGSQQGGRLEVVFGTSYNMPVVSIMGLPTRNS